MRFPCLPPIALAVAALLATHAKAQAPMLTRRDRLEMLYSDQLPFTPAGEPLITVRVIGGLTRIQVRSDAPMVVEPVGDPASQVRVAAGARWTITLDGAHAGKARSWVAAERFSASDVARVAAARDRWAGMGFTPHVFEAGAVLGLGGHLIDSRTVTIGVEPSPTRAAAAKQGEALRARLSMLGEVVDEPLMRPGGVVVAREARSGVEVLASDLLAMRIADDVPNPDATLALVDVKWPRHGRGTRHYRGELLFLVGPDRKLLVVNSVPAETLLEGVVPSEIFPNAPAEALKAQAVAARGQLLAKVGVRHRGEP
ncbi:MAG: SpoIID/LytB domain-containing protein, partial [Myxococcales bacterium]|nr:SpoIID/LytB domain-containing protein [Myxococcales bacterium]